MQYIDKVDDDVVRAGEEARASGRLTPLIKIELWSKIQARRLSEGKEELNVEFTAPNHTPLTAEEEVKSKKRRDSNKEAAHRCRQRRKARENENQKELEKLMIKNKDLKEKAAELEEELQFYKGFLSIESSTQVDLNPASPEQQVPGLWTGEDIIEHFL
ncbi:uncharacterized protein LOC125652332 isoform X2 [Ostrea edulis]|nr:uncharacterized protein LOC125652332 isoform X2 [Ostrea edulis]XP_056021304.1 uncharacterized protein LOC125652332 isoform X2 [Ostrea edulis]